MRRTLVLLAALSLLLVGLIPGAGADPATKADRATRPFAVALSITNSFGPVSTDVCPPGDPYGPPEGGVGTTAEGAGIALGLGRHLREVTSTSFHCSSLAIRHGDLTITTTNGDELFVQYGPCPLADPPFPPPYEDGQRIRVRCPFVISGGTGRFEHAWGSGTSTVRLTFPSFGGTWLIWGTIGY